MYSANNLLTAILLILFTLGSGCDKTSITSYTIRVPNSPDSLVNLAAQELQSLIFSSTKHMLPIKSNVSEGEPQIHIDYLIQQVHDPHAIYYEIRGDKVAIQGGSSQSILHAVYEFAEHELGARFYAPDYTYIPKRASLNFIPKDYHYTPPVTTRTVHSRLFYENHGFADRLKVTHEAFPGYVPTARVHTFHRFMPGEEYFETHPEYYALVNGRRLTTQLCLTNPDVLRIVKEQVANYFEEYPDRPIISVSQDDNTQYCRCANCSAIDTQEESPAGSMIYFVNEIARSFPNKTISTLAYQYTRKAPKSIKPEDNVLITLCSIECDRSVPIRKGCTDFANDLMAWGKITDNVRIWDYTTQFTNFLAPFPNLRTLQPNIQLFENNNARWIFQQHSHQPSELFELRSYLTAKLLWDPTVDADSISQNFLNGYYGEGGSFVKKYIDHVHDALDQDSSFFLFLYGDPSQGFQSFLSAENLALYNEWYDKAMEAIGNDPDLKSRIEAARLSVDYATLEAIRKGLSEKYSLKNSDEVSDRLQRFRRVTSEHNITMMNEMRYSVEEYLDSYERLVTRASKPNIAYSQKVTLLTNPKKYADEDPQALTDGAYGGANFYSNWLGFEGNHLEAVFDLGNTVDIKRISTAFLQVVNHIVFFPKAVSFAISEDGLDYQNVKSQPNPRPLTRESKINDIWNIELNDVNIQGRYLKIEAENMNVAPSWHHGAGLPSWIFIDEVEVE